jgi:hypothetical protein
MAASAVSNPLSHTVPQALLWYTSSRPSDGLPPFTSLIFVPPQSENIIHELSLKQVFLTPF